MCFDLKFKRLMNDRDWKWQKIYATGKRIGSTVEVGVGVSMVP